MILFCLFVWGLTIWPNKIKINQSKPNLNKQLWPNQPNLKAKQIIIDQTKPKLLLKLYQCKLNSWMKRHMHTISESVLLSDQEMVEDRALVDEEEDRQDGLGDQEEEQQ